MYNKKSSPSRTPLKKQTKSPSLLDPTRLKPPPEEPSSDIERIGLEMSTNSRINYGVGIQNQLENDGDLSSPNRTPDSDVNAIISVADTNIS